MKSSCPHHFIVTFSAPSQTFCLIFHRFQLDNSVKCFFMLLLNLSPLLFIEYLRYLISFVKEKHKKWETQKHAVPGNFCFVVIFMSRLRLRGNFNCVFKNKKALHRIRVERTVLWRYFWRSYVTTRVKISNEAKCKKLQWKKCKWKKIQMK